MMPRNRISRFIKAFGDEARIVCPIGIMGGFTICLIKILDCNLGGTVCDEPIKVFASLFSSIGAVVLIGASLVFASRKGSSLLVASKFRNK